jgi:flagellar basal-body rod protein FlgB
MINALFNQPNYLAAKKMMDATALRQEAIASNLANLETPNYKRLDVNPSFQTELQRALASKDAASLAGVQPQLQVDASAVAQTLDGNTVQMERELMLMNQNGIDHALEAQLITGNLLRLKLAITGRPA